MTGITEHKSAGECVCMGADTDDNSNNIHTKNSFIEKNTHEIMKWNEEYKEKQQQLHTYKNFVWREREKIDTRIT